MSKVTFRYGPQLPLEMHKVRVVQKLTLLPVEQRLQAMTAAGNNTFLLQNADVYLDMLTDSGVNAMSDNQVAAMMIADDSYAGSATFTRLATKLKEIFGLEHVLPVHQGRAAEKILAQVYVSPGDVVPMNYHFTTTKAHIVARGGRVAELYRQGATDVTSDEPFKGDLDVDALESLLADTAVRVPFVRMEAGTNLIGGQPFSLANLQAVRAVCDRHGVPLVLDASLLADNLHFISVREDACRALSIREIAKAVADQCDIVYFSARKLGHARGGAILVRDADAYRRMRGLVPFYEGFLTYGGMSVREMEAITVGLDETMDPDMISQGPLFIEHMVGQLVAHGVPVITPAGGLGAHLDASEFCAHVPQVQYPAGALASALPQASGTLFLKAAEAPASSPRAALASAFYIASGVRGMERGTLSEQRNPDGSEELASMELLRLAMPRRVFTLSQVSYAIDRIVWLWENRSLIGGLEFTEEPEVLRFFYGRLKPVSGWQQQLVTKFRADFGDSL